jgi:CDP-glycerol glycerophosphotransferase (TagB/SpsB family)
MIPKNKNIWIFGAWFGDKYADNSKFLFEYVNEYHPSIRAVWLTNSEDIVDQLKEKDYEVYKKYSFKSILLGVRAQYSIFVHSNFVDCMPFLNNKQTKLIQLWHGSPIKKIGYDTEIIRKNKSFDKFKYTLFPFLYEESHLFTALGKKDSQVYSN